MDARRGLDVDELIVITGHLKESSSANIVEHYDIPAKFVEQKKLDGTAGAINLARPYVDCPVLIIFVDTVFEADLSLINRVDADGIIWAKEVEDYQRFGVIVNGRGRLHDPHCREAEHAGLAAREHRVAVHQGLGSTVRRHRAHADTSRRGRAASTNLTDCVPVHGGPRPPPAHRAGGGWYDCGKVDTLLETNQHLLEHGRARIPSGPCPRCNHRAPVYIEDGVTMHDATVGPNVSIEAGSFIPRAPS